MSALPPRADIRLCRWDVRKVPEADIEVLCIAQSMVAQRSYQASRSPESSRKAYGYDEDRPYETAWAHLEAREPFRDRQKDDELQNALRKLVFDSAGSDKINFDTLCDRVLASMPDTWIVFTSGEPHRSPKVSF
jgi:hypothetical protein